MPDNSLISYASRIEAAVKSYLEVREIANADLWRAEFEKEKVSLHWASPRRFDLIPICYRLLSPECLSASET